MTFGVVNTKNKTTWNLMHDGANPYAVVKFSKHGTIIAVISRHSTMIGANIKAGKEQHKFNKNKNLNFSH